MEQHIDTPQPTLISRTVLTSLPDGDLIHSAIQICATNYLADSQTFCPRQQRVAITYYGKTACNQAPLAQLDRASVYGTEG